MGSLMKLLHGNYLQRWLIPFGSAAVFFLLLAFLIPYSASLYEVKKSLARLILSMSSFGQSTENFASLDFTYCLFVPVIFAYLVYLRWNDLERAPIRQSNSGLGLIGLGVL